MSEVVDVVDAEDRVVGSVPRESLRGGAFNHRVVHVLVVDGEGSLLLQRPASSRGATFALGSSVAGHVMSGESYAAAAARELEEELGVEPPAFLDLGTTWVDEGGGRKFVGVFVARSRGPFSPDPTEIERLEWRPVAWVRAEARARPDTFSATFLRVFRHADSATALDLG